MQLFEQLLLTAVVPCTMDFVNSGFVGNRLHQQFAKNQRKTYLKGDVVKQDNIIVFY